MKIQDFNVTTGEITERELTQEEIVLRQEIENSQLNLENEIAQKAAAKAALLERLGISEDEAKLLFS